MINFSFGSSKSYFNSSMNHLDKAKSSVLSAGVNFSWASKGAVSTALQVYQGYFAFPKVSGDIITAYATKSLFGNNLNMIPVAANIAIDVAFKVVTTHSAPALLASVAVPIILNPSNLIDTVKYTAKGAWDVTKFGYHVSAAAVEITAAGVLVGKEIVESFVKDQSIDDLDITNNVSKQQSVDERWFDIYNDKVVDVKNNVEATENGFVLVPKEDKPVMIDVMYEETEEEAVIYDATLAGLDTYAPVA
ncbi:MAG: hypothetical protein ACRYE9_05315 [Janthinobacterium lividum]